MISEFYSCINLPQSTQNIMKEFLEIIRISVVHLTEIIENMMKFSKVNFFSNFK